MISLLVWSTLYRVFWKKVHPFPSEEKRKIESVLDLFGSVVVFHVIEVLALVDDMATVLSAAKGLELSDFQIFCREQ